MYSRNALGASLHLARNKTKSFEDLATRAHDMELSMTFAGKDMTIGHDPHKGRDKQEPMRCSKFVPRNDNKESMSVNMLPTKFTTMRA